MTRTGSEGHRPPEGARCIACGVLGTVGEMTEAQGGVCCDEAACLSRMMRNPQNMPDPYASVGLRMDLVRGQLDQASTSLSYLQDIVGALRVQVHQVRGDTRLNDDVLEDVCRAIAPHRRSPEADSFWLAKAKAAILVTRGGDPARVIMAHARHHDGNQAQRVTDAAEALWDRHAQDPMGAADTAPAAAAWPTEGSRRVYRCAETRRGRGPHIGALRRVQVRHDVLERRAGADIILCRAHLNQAVRNQEVRKLAMHEPAVPAAVYPDDAVDLPVAYMGGAQCIEDRYDERGDCVEPMYEASIPSGKHVWGAGPGEPVYLCRSHYVQARDAGEAEAGRLVPRVAPEYDGEVVLREGVVVRSGDTLVVSYPDGTGPQKILTDLRVLRGQMPEGARVTVVTGAQVSVIRADEGL